MWCIRKGNQVIKIIPGAMAITIDQVQHPPSIFKLWTNEELANISVFPFSEEFRDHDFYTYSKERYDIQSDRVIKVWDTKTPKNMDELKTKYINLTKSSALNRLSETDWYVTRKVETGEDVPSDVATYRQAVRDAEKNIIKLINAKKTVTGLKGMLVSSDEESNPSMYDWPSPLE
jgi:hypothetical protein